MKTKYLLSALAISTAFVACDKDEQMMVNNNANTNGQEVVGADLLGTGLSINIGTSEGSQTRATATGWALGDVAGLGWVVEGDPFDSQTGVKLVNVGSKLFNNHYYAYQGDGAWNTQGNIYKGWHFAYFPYQYHEEVMPLSFNGKNSPEVINTLNPTFKTLHAGNNNAYKADITSNAPHISAAAYLDKNKVNTAAGTIEEKFAVERIVNVLLPVLNLHSDFKKAPLNNLAIEKIKLFVGKPIFPVELAVNPAALPENVYTEGNFDVVETRKALIAKLFDETTPVLTAVGDEYYQSWTTMLEEGTFTLGNTDDNNRHWLRMFLAPAKKGVTTARKDLYVEITVEGGHKFVINADDAANQAAIDKLFDLTKNGGLFRKLSKDGETITAPQGVHLYLNKDNFVKNFVIDENNSWENCVGIVDALGYQNPTFTIADGYAVEFGDAEKMLAPKNTGVTVVSNGASKLQIVGTTAWNEKITVGDGVTVEVAETGVLTTDDECLKSVALVNNGKILAGAEATVGKKGLDTKFKNNGEIIIEYGAFVYPTVDSEGYVSYELKEGDGVYRVNKLVSGGKDGSANVNKFIVNGEKYPVWNLDAEISATGGSGDRYDFIEGEDAKYYDFSKLNNVDVEIINAVVSTENYNGTGFPGFTNVTMTGADAKLIGVDVSGDLTVEGQGEVTCGSLNNVTTDGSFTADNVEGDVDAEGDVTVKYYINGDIINANNVTVEVLSVTGNINATGDVVVKMNITGDVKAKSVRAAAADGNVEATNGDVNLSSIADGKSIEANGNVTVANDTYGNIEATGNVTVGGMILGGGNVKGKTITADHIVADVVASGDVIVVESGDIVGNVAAVNITANEITGNVTAAGNVTVADRVNGNVELTGESTSIECPTVTGNVDINANSVTAKIAGISEKLTVNGTKFTLNYTESVVNIKDIEILTSKNMTVAKNTKVLVSNIIKVNTKAKLTASASGAAVLYGVDLTIEGTGSVVGNVKKGTSF